MAKPYQFVTTWHLAHSVEEVWPTLTSPAAWPQWWQGLEASRVAAGSSGRLGGQIELAWRAPMGYRLNFTLTITQIRQPHELIFTARGDLNGVGSCHVTPESSGSTVVIAWDVVTNKAWMKRLRWILGPVFRLNHALLMRAGYQGLAQHLLAKTSKA